MMYFSLISEFGWLICAKKVYSSVHEVYWFVFFFPYDVLLGFSIEDMLAL